MRRTILIFLVLLLVITNSLWSSGKVVYALDLSDSYYATIPHFKDEIPFRSSNAISISVGLIGYETESYSVGLDLHTMFVTASIPFGYYQEKSFNSVGLKVRGSYKFNRTFGIFGSISNEVNYYSNNEAFISFSFQVGPQFRVLQTEIYALDITIPVTINLRKEITAPMLGVGIRYTLAQQQKQEKL